MASDGYITVDAKATVFSPARSSSSLCMDVQGGSVHANLAVLASAAGIVDEVGSGAEASGISVGDAVAVALMPNDIPGSNGKIEVPVGRVIPAPAGSSHKQAATFVHVATSVMLGIGHDLACNMERISGKTVVVCGGKGPAGSLAIQLLSGAGAKVVAMSSGGWWEDKELLEMGASSTLQYKKESFYDVLGGKIDIVVDALGAGGDEQTMLRSNGVKYADVTSPAVKLVLNEGLLGGGLELKRFNDMLESGSSPSLGEFSTASLTETGVSGLTSLSLLAGSRGVEGKGGLRFDSQSYTAWEWLEALGWPRDLNTGGRHGFPGKSMWPKAEELEEKRSDVLVVAPGVEVRRRKDRSIADSAAAAAAAVEKEGMATEDNAAGIAERDKEEEEEEGKAAAAQKKLKKEEEEQEEEKREEAAAASTAAAAKKETEDSAEKVSSVKKVEEDEGIESTRREEDKEVDVDDGVLSGAREVGGGVIDVKSIAEIGELVGDKRAMLYFYSKTCRACAGMKPKFSKLAKARVGTGDVFISCDAKMLGAKEVEEAYGVVELPSFVVLKRGEKRGEWTGTFEGGDLRRMLEGMFA
jgi:thiol-disulfide isomerase/thioredoxin